MAWMTWFCSICSGPLLWRHPPDWLSTTRLLGPVSDNDNADDYVVFISGRYENNHGSGLLWVEDPDPYDEENYGFNTGNGERYIYGFNDAGQCLLPAHECCIELVQRFSFGNGSTKRVVEGEMDPTFRPLYEKLCSAARYDEHGIHRPNGGYGAEQFWDQDWIEEEGWEWLLADPINVPGISKWLFQNLEVMETQGNEHTTAVITAAMLNEGPRVEVPALARLPADVVSIIVDEIDDAISVLNLRKTCKSMYLKIPLNQSFWRKQLLNGSLVPWLWDVDSSQLFPTEDVEQSMPQRHGKMYNWHKLCKDIMKLVFNDELMEKMTPQGAETETDDELEPLDIRHAATGPMQNAPDGLLNRSRIWQMCRDL
ncbi:hypothetical protein F5884DRAFT_795568 [Xylogone sp. PMI_703]|nr:hypothetical protein F5884DRAFT_795568 [Xylogone sp. PMI_703]